MFGRSVVDVLGKTFLEKIEIPLILGNLKNVGLMFKSAHKCENNGIFKQNSHTLLLLKFSFGEI